MFYLYKKTHNITGISYLGYTKKDPYVYKGSGTYWMRHLDVHGNNVTTEVLHKCETKSDIKILGRFYSDLWDIVKSPNWANIKPEEADGGDMRGSEIWNTTMKSESHRNKHADIARGNTNVRGMLWWSNIVTGELIRDFDKPGDDWVNKFMEHYEETKTKISNALTGLPKSIEHRKNLCISAIGRPSNAKGTIWVKDSCGNRKRVKPENIPSGYLPVKNYEEN